jgi:cell division protease FtsH
VHGFFDHLLAQAEAADRASYRLRDPEHAGLARRVLLETHRDKVEAMTKALLEWETIDAEQIEDIIQGKPPRPPKSTASGKPPAGGKPTPGGVEGAAQPA